MPHASEGVLATQVEVKHKTTVAEIDAHKDTPQEMIKRLKVLDGGWNILATRLNNDPSVNGNRLRGNGALYEYPHSKVANEAHNDPRKLVVARTYDRKGDTATDVVCASVRKGHTYSLEIGVGKKKGNAINGEVVDMPLAHIDFTVKSPEDLSPVSDDLTYSTDDTPVNTFLLNERNQPYYELAQKLKANSQLYHQLASLCHSEVKLNEYSVAQAVYEVFILGEKNELLPQYAKKDNNSVDLDIPSYNWYDSSEIDPFPSTHDIAYPRSMGSINILGVDKRAISREARLDRADSRTLVGRSINIWRELQGRMNNHSFETMTDAVIDWFGNKMVHKDTRGIYVQQNERGFVLIGARANTIRALDRSGRQNKGILRQPEKNWKGDVHELKPGVIYSATQDAVGRKRILFVDSLIHQHYKADVTSKSNVSDARIEVGLLDVHVAERSVEEPVRNDSVRYQIMLMDEGAVGLPITPFNFTWRRQEGVSIEDKFYKLALAQPHFIEQLRRVKNPEDILNNNSDKELTTEFLRTLQGVNTPAFGYLIPLSEDGIKRKEEMGLGKPRETSSFYDKYTSRAGSFPSPFQ